MIQNVNYVLRRRKFLVLSSFYLIQDKADDRLKQPSSVKMENFQELGSSLFRRIITTLCQPWNSELPLLRLDIEMLTLPDKCCNAAVRGTKTKICHRGIHLFTCNEFKNFKVNAA